MSDRVDLPPGWVQTELGEIGAWSGGGTPSKTNDLFWKAGTIPWVSPKDMKTFRIDDSEDHITELALKETVVRLCSPGSILVVVRSGILQRTLPVAITRVPVTLNQDMKSITPFEKIIPDYVAYYLNSREREILDTCSKDGTTVASIESDQLRHFPIALAPLAEQRRIVEAIEQQFTRLDAGVAALKRAQVALKRYRAAVLKAASEGKLTESWRAEHPNVEPASALLERILAERRARWEADLRARGKDPAKAKYEEPRGPDTTNLPDLPESWRWATAEQLSDETRAITYGVIKLGDPDENGIPTLRSSNVRHLRLELDGVKRISSSLANEYKRTFLRGGEILVTVRGTLGGVAMIPDTLAGYNISREVAMIAPVEKELAPCMALFIGSPATQNWIMRNTKGIAYTGLNIESLKALPIPVPPLAEQREIVTEIERRLSVVSELEATFEANFKRAERLRQSLLERAFAGKLVPQDPNDEPASVLLERILHERTVQDATRSMTKTITPGGPRQSIFRPSQGELWHIVAVSELDA